MIIIFFYPKIYKDFYLLFMFDCIKLFLHATLLIQLTRSQEIQYVRD